MKGKDCNDVVFNTTHRYTSISYFFQASLAKKCKPNNGLDSLAHG